MSHDAVRKALLAKKAEIEDALRELDRIEALAGLREQSPPNVNGKSISQAVLDAIVEKKRSVEQLASDLGITESQVINALTSHRLRHVVRSRKIEGIRVFEAIEELPTTEKGLSRKPLTEAIEELLGKHPDQTFSIADVVTGLPKRIDSKAKDFAGTVATTLANLAKVKRIDRVGTGEYQSSRSR